LGGEEKLNKEVLVENAKIEGKKEKHEHLRTTLEKMREDA
jgi:hypothetical protein